MPLTEYHCSKRHEPLPRYCRMREVQRDGQCIDGTTETTERPRDGNCYIAHLMHIDTICVRRHRVFPDRTQTQSERCFVNDPPCDKREYDRQIRRQIHPLKE